MEFWTGEPFSEDVKKQIVSEHDDDVRYALYKDICEEKLANDDEGA